MRDSKQEAAGRQTDHATQTETEHPPTRIGLEQEMETKKNLHRLSSGEVNTGPPPRSWYAHPQVSGRQAA